MRSVAKTFLIALVLSVLAVVSTTLLFTRSIPLEELPHGSTVGFTGTTGGPDFAAGIDVLSDFISEPAFAVHVLLPQFATYLVFLWVAALLGSRLRPDRAAT
jgi:hypothetical protein